MTTENEQITPADAAIVSSGTGSKGPEERDLPASLKEEMDLCLQILRVSSCCRCEFHFLPGHFFSHEDSKGTKHTLRKIQ